MKPAKTPRIPKIGIALFTLAFLLACWGVKLNAADQPPLQNALSDAEKKVNVR